MVDQIDWELVGITCPDGYFIVRNPENGNLEKLVDNRNKQFQAYLRLSPHFPQKEGLPKGDSGPEPDGVGPSTSSGCDFGG